jgi:uncharacterized damage-inducible protein DinB
LEKPPGSQPAPACLACDIGPAKNVQEFVRHIWTAELRWAQCLAGVPVITKEQLPKGRSMRCSLCTRRQCRVYRSLLAAADEEWSKSYVLEFDWVPVEARTVSRRKIAMHALFHSQRHWAQLTTLIRQRGFPSGFRGDLLFSMGLK